MGFLMFFCLCSPHNVPPTISGSVLFNSRASKNTAGENMIISKYLSTIKGHPSTPLNVRGYLLLSIDERYPHLQSRINDTHTPQNSIRILNLLRRFPGKIHIECAPSDDGLERFACPTPDRMGRYRCIDDHMLCDGFIDCAAAEDEDRMACMFFRTTKAHLDVLADALLRWARGRY
ncbi:uncharacterized protein NPIL_189711 [Nephila pilipes]|uniref:Uncharacterized protein n=1 Tax=Nephila pilipes TaxID=299642 RepID=A0A8X6PPA7_NEPPI|nr:uncharacterized protein NPIL_189711 [Nephila pilipes]